MSQSALYPVMANGSGVCSCGTGGSCTRCASQRREVVQSEASRRRRVPGRPAASQRPVVTRPPVTTRPPASTLPPARARVLPIPVWGGGPTLADLPSTDQNRPSPQPAVISGPLRVQSPTDIVVLQVGESTVRLQRAAALAWSAMVAAARKAGLPAPFLWPRCSRTTFQQQEQLWRQAVNILGSAAEASHWATVPGIAVSRDGVTIELDLQGRSSGNQPGAVQSDAAVRWLQQNAARFGFVRAGRSAARWTYRPQSAAAGRAGVQEEVDPATALAGASLGVAVFQTIQSMVGTSSCTSNVVTYQHPNTPPATRVRNVYSFQISAQNVFSDPEVFRYRLTFESNGYDIFDARVEEFNSDNLYLSSFSVNFNFVAVSQTSVVLESKALVTGRWNRVGLGDYRFQDGEILIRGDGTARIQRRILSEGDSVQFQPMTVTLISRETISGPAPTPSAPSPPAPGPRPAATSGTLRLGSSGPLVVELQQRLNLWLGSRGMAALAVDGQFGNGTLSAVRQFQAAHKLAADGVVGQMTWSVLRSRY